jgi:hypothetical protein
MVVDLGLEKDGWCIADMGVFFFASRRERKVVEGGESEGRGGWGGKKKKRERKMIFRFKFLMKSQITSAK